MERRALAWLYIRPISERFALVATAVDIAAITTLAALSGGPFSQARLAYFLVPVAVAFRFRPAVTADAGAGSIAAYLGQAFAHPSASEPEATRFVLVQAGYLAWISAAALLLSAVLRRRTDRVVELAAERERLMREAVSAEEGSGERSPRRSTTRRSRTCSPRATISRSWKTSSRAPPSSAQRQRSRAP